METSSRHRSGPVISTQLPEQVQEQSMQREYVTPEQDPEAVRKCVHRVRVEVARLAEFAADPVTREAVICEASNIQLGFYDYSAVASFTRARLPYNAA